MSLPTRAERRGAFGLSDIGAEVLDSPSSDPALVVRMLRDIARANRWLGGWHAVRFGLARLLTRDDRGHRLTLLDVGTGAGDLPRQARAWARRHGVDLVALGVERLPAAARLAHKAGVPTTIACASELPVRDRGVDVVLVSQVAHHLNEASATALFADCSRIARRGVVVADLRPSVLSGVTFRLAGPLLGLHPVTVADGVTSLRRGFTPRRLFELCRQAAPGDVHVASRPGSRLTAWWRTDR